MMALIWEGGKEGGREGGREGGKERGMEGGRRDRYFKHVSNYVSSVTILYLIYSVLDRLRAQSSDEGVEGLVLPGLGQSRPTQLTLFCGPLPSDHDLGVGLRGWRGMESLQTLTCDG